MPGKFDSTPPPPPPNSSHLSTICCNARVNEMSSCAVETCYFDDPVRLLKVKLIRAYPECEFH